MKKLIEIRDVDAHYVIFILGYPVIRIKHNVKKYDQRNVTEWGLNTSERNVKITASLTTFPARIHKVHKTIENLLTQTVKPDRLILWLSDKEFPNKDADLPESLLRLKDFGLSIEWCDYMRSYQKLVPTLLKYPDDIVVTFDDDFYYPKTILEDLYNSYLKNPKDIHAHRTWRGEVIDGEIVTKSNTEMLMTKFNDASYENLLMGYGGVLYPPHSLSEKFSDAETFKRLIFTNDDVWFWAMSVLRRTKTRQVNGFEFSIDTVEDTQEVGLFHINGDKSGNSTPNMAINLMLKEFPEIEKIMSEDKNG